MSAKMPIIQVPMCAICRKPVDEILQWANYDRRTIGFRVKCHGDSESCELEEELLAMADIATITVGEAFTTKSLPPPQEPSKLTDIYPLLDPL